MSTYKHFPNIEIPKPIEGWEDHSSDQDVTARSVLPLPDGTEIWFWVSHDDVNKRDIDATEWGKYLVEHHFGDNDGDCDYGGDNLDEAMKAVFEIFKQYGVSV